MFNNRNQRQAQDAYCSRCRVNGHTLDECETIAACKLCGGEHYEIKCRFRDKGDGMENYPTKAGMLSILTRIREAAKQTDPEAFATVDNEVRTEIQREIASAKFHAQMTEYNTATMAMSQPARPQPAGMYRRA